LAASIFGCCHDRCAAGHQPWRLRSRSAVPQDHRRPEQSKNSEIDLDLKRFSERCWTQQLHKPGKPVEQRHGNLWWLTKMPLADYHIDNGRGGGSILYRFVPLIR